MKASIYFLSFIGAATSCTAKENASGLPQRSQAVRIAQVKVGTMTEGHRYLAKVVPTRTVRVIAQIRGTVSALPVPDGQFVSKGKPLARILAPDLAARMARVRAERERTEQERDFACKQTSTDRRLAQAGDIPGVRLDRSEKNCSAAQLAANAARAAEREAAVAMSKNAERAPFDGVVLARVVEVGQTVMPGTTLLQFASTEIQLRLRVPVGDNISLGTRVRHHSFSGRVVEVGVQATGPGRLVQLKVELDPETKLHLGSTMTVTLVTAEEMDATQVPQSAVGEDSEGTFVLVVNNDKLERVPVTLGLMEDGWVGIRPQLKSGTHVATGRVEDLDLSRPVLAVAP